VPDIVTEEARITKSEAGDRLREADLARHRKMAMKSPSRKKNRKRKTRKTTRRRTRPASRGRGLPVQEALNLLKGISFWAQGK
jgi:hypothetical protein